MFKSFLGFALCGLFLTAILPAAFSDPTKEPHWRGEIKDPEGGITQISFTRTVEDQDPLGYKEETVTFYGHVRGINKSNRVTRSLTTFRYNAKNVAQEEQRDLFQSSDLSVWNDFFYLTKLLTSAKFFEFKGDNTVTALGTYALDPWIRISAVRNGITKTLAMDSAPPEGMWALQAALRGVASDIVWRKVDKPAEAESVKPK